MSRATRQPGLSSDLFVLCELSVILAAFSQVRTRSGHELHIVNVILTPPFRHREKIFL